MDGWMAKILSVESEKVRKVHVPSRLHYLQLLIHAEGEIPPSGWHDDKRSIFFVTSMLQVFQWFKHSKT